MRYDTFTTSELQQLRQRADTLRIMAGDDLTRRFIAAVSSSVDGEILRREGQKQFVEILG